MLIVESATEILNLITGVSKFYVCSVEILTADCRVVGIRLLAVAFIACSSRNCIVHYILTGYLKILKFKKSVSSSNQLLNVSKNSVSTTATPSSVYVTKAAE
jgi:hypothetical protein